MFFSYSQNAGRVRSTLTQQMCSQLMQKFIVTFGTGGNSCCTLCATPLATIEDPHSFSLEVPRIPNPTPMAAQLTVKLPHSRGCRKEKHEKTWHTHLHSCVYVSCALFYLLRCTRRICIVRATAAVAETAVQFLFLFSFHFINVENVISSTCNCCGYIPIPFPVFTHFLFFPRGGVPPKKISMWKIGKASRASLSCRVICGQALKFNKGKSKLCPCLRWCQVGKC